MADVKDVIDFEHTNETENELSCGRADDEPEVTTE